MKKTRILTRLYGVTPTVVLLCNLIKERHVIQQHYNVTTHKVYAVTLLLWKAKTCFGSIADGLDHVNPVIRLPLERGISRVLGLGTMAGVDINTLIMEQYLTLSRENHTLGMVKPEIKGNVNFQTRSQFMRDLMEDTFFGKKIRMLMTMLIESSTFNNNADRLTAIVSKLDNLGRDMKKLKDNVHPIQVGCQIFNGLYLDKECPLNEKIKQVEEVNYGEFGHPAPFYRNYVAKFRVGPPGYYTRTDNQTPSGEKKPNLAETINKYIDEAAKRQAEQDEWLKTFCQSTENSWIDHDKIIQKLESQVIPELKSNLPKQTINHYVEPYIPPIIFPNQLKQHAREALAHKTMDSLKKIRINRPLLKEIKKTDNYPKYMKDLVANKQLTEEDDEVNMNPRCSALLQNELPPKENDPGSFILPCSIRRKPVILGRHLLATAHAKVDIFRKTISLEVGNEKEVQIIGNALHRTTPVLIVKVNVTRYSIGPGKVYTKMKILEVEELSRTRVNIATIRARIMDEIVMNDYEKESYDET
nr:hypothetical protein [Tanacetum cinerariifolium]